jgi:glycosyltransferase involved in cell wall biosynthesis
MAAKFLVVNNGMTEARGHFVETGVAVARAARARGFDVAMGVHARCTGSELPNDLPTLPLFRVDHWGHIVAESPASALPLRGELAPLSDTPIEAVLDGRATLRELLDSRFAPPQHTRRSLKTRLAHFAKQTLPPIAMTAFRALMPPVGFQWIRAISRKRRGLPPAPWADGAHTANDFAPLPRDTEGLLRRALNRTPPDHNEFAHYQMFAADLERFLTLCNAGPSDHVYFPTAYGRDAIAVGNLAQRIGIAKLPTFHLEYRHAVLSPRELECEPCAFKAFHTRSLRAYFDACRAFPESPNVRFYTDTAELARDYSALAGFPFAVLPIPFRANLIPQSPSRTDDTLRVLFLGDLREEKGFTKLPQLVRATRDNPRVQFVIPGALHAEEREPAMLAALAELEAYPAEKVSRPFRDHFVPASDYYTLLAAADVVLCPYDAHAYRARSSGVFAEAVAAGKPTIVPAETWMANEQEPGSGEVYRDERGLLTALQRVIADYPRYRKTAALARERWLQRHSPEQLVSQLVDASNPRTVTSTRVNIAVRA